MKILKDFSKFEVKSLKMIVIIMFKVTATVIPNRLNQRHSNTTRGPKWGHQNENRAKTIPKSARRTWPGDVQATFSYKLKITINVLA